jgi:hypothetical protein
MIAHEFRKRIYLKSKFCYVQLILIALCAVSGCATMHPTPDTDSNGVRDDIDNYINGFAKNDTKMANLTQYGRAVQASVEVDANDRIAVTAVKERYLVALSFLYSASGMGQSEINQFTAEIKSLTTDTLIRARHVP